MSSISENQINDSTSNNVNEDLDEVKNIELLIDSLRDKDAEIEFAAKCFIKLKKEREVTYKTILKELKGFQKKAKKTKKKYNGGGGLSIKLGVSSELKTLLKLDEELYSRGEITKHICAYIKDNNLKNPVDAKLLLINKESPFYKFLKIKEEDGKLRSLDNDEIKTIKVFGGINKYIQHHFIKN